jgi:hypothetical protein
VKKNDLIASHILMTKKIPYAQFMSFFYPHVFVLSCSAIICISSGTVSKIFSRLKYLTLKIPPRLVFIKSVSVKSDNRKKR